MPALFLNKYVIGLTLAVALVCGAYLKGYSTGYKRADQSARIAALQADLAAARQDLTAQARAAELNRQAAAENQRTAAAAEERIREYEIELQKRGEDARCRLNDEDVRVLRDRAAGGAGTEPAAGGTGRARPGAATRH